MKIYVEFEEGKIIDIKDLPQEQYEQFLELMHKLRIAYYVIQEERGTKTQ